MNAHLNLLATRRALLVAQSAVQRQVLADEIASWEAPLRSGERLLARVAWARAHLSWLFAAGAALAASPQLRGWLLRGWYIWRAARRLRAAESR